MLMCISFENWLRFLSRIKCDKLFVTSLCTHVLICYYFCCSSFFCAFSCSVETHFILLVSTCWFTFKSYWMFMLRRWLSFTDSKLSSFVTETLVMWTQMVQSRFWTGVFAAKGRLSASFSTPSTSIIRNTLKSVNSLFFFSAFFPRLMVLRGDWLDCLFCW